jgi:hypothetical protein
VEPKPENGVEEVCEAVEDAKSEEDAAPEAGRVPVVDPNREELLAAAGVALVVPNPKLGWAADEVCESENPVEPDVWKEKPFEEVVAVEPAGVGFAKENPEADDKDEDGPPRKDGVVVEAVVPAPKAVEVEDPNCGEENVVFVEAVVATAGAEVVKVENIGGEVWEGKVEGGEEKADEKEEEEDPNWLLAVNEEEAAADDDGVLNSGVEVEAVLAEELAEAEPNEKE